MGKDVLLSTDSIFKEFGATKALRDVSVEFYRGEVRGLIGENGSGKSTLANMITGVYPPTSGGMFYGGAAYHPQSVLDAKRKGIVLLAQELGTINDLTVVENMFLGEESLLSKFGDVSIRRLSEETEKILAENGIKGVKPGNHISSYSFEVRKIIEVARALRANPEILIVDETTTALSQRGRERIYEIIKNQREAGKSVIFISHDLAEIQAVCDSVTVLRDGEYIADLSKEEINAATMRTLMVGRELSGAYYRADSERGYRDEAVLSVENICLDGVLNDISFKLYKGEILGIGGLTESGMHDLCKVIFGAVKPTSGRAVLLKNGTVLSDTETAVKNKTAYFPKDRDQESLFQATDIQDNIVASSMSKLEKFKFIFPRAEKKLARKQAQEMSVKMNDINQLVSDLSGGNKQKVVIAKWLANDSEVLIMDCPTRGIDIGVKANIYRLMEKLKAEGRAIIMVSEEMEELLGMSDRILVMKDGRITGEFNRSADLDQYAIVEKMI